MIGRVPTNIPFSLVSQCPQSIIKSLVKQGDFDITIFRYDRYFMDIRGFPWKQMSTNSVFSTSILISWRARRTAGTGHGVGCPEQTVAVTIGLALMALNYIIMYTIVSMTYIVNQPI